MRHPHLECCVAILPSKQKMGKEVYQKVLKKKNLGEIKNSKKNAKLIHKDAAKQHFRLFPFTMCEETGKKYRYKLNKINYLEHVFFPF